MDTAARERWDRRLAGELVPIPEQGTFGVTDHEEMRVLFRGREYRLTFSCDREARRMSDACDVREGEHWMPVAGHTVKENEIVFRRAFEALLQHAFGGER